MFTLFHPSKRYALPADAEIVDKGGKPHARIRDGKRYELYPLTRDGKGYIAPEATWAADVPHANGRRKRVRFSPNKDAAAAMLAKLLTEIEEEKAGIKRPSARQQARPLSALLAEYRGHHADQGNTPEQTTLTVRRCEVTFTGCGFLTLADLDAAAADRWMAARRRESPRFGAQTRNHYVAALKAFGNWLLDTRKTTENPFRPLAKQNVAVDLRHERRPLTPEEFDRLLLAARTGKRFGKLSGPDRAMLYTVAAYTGFRASELASLTPASFALETTPPTLTVEAGYSKHRRKDTVPVHLELAAVLRPWFAGKPADAPLWPGKWAKNHYAADLLRHDLAAARAVWIAEGVTSEDSTRREQSDFLSYEDANGGKADFHALRHKFITELVKAGVQPKDAKELARHSTITLTMDRYAHTTLTDTAEALSRMTIGTVGSSNGAARGAAEGGDGRRESETAEETRTPLAPAAGIDPETTIPLTPQGFEGYREGSKTTDERRGRDSNPRSGLARLRFSRPGDDAANSSESQHNPHIDSDGSSTGSSNPANATAYTPNGELARVVELWPNLPPAIRAAILTLVNTSAPAPTKPEQDRDEDRLPPGYERQAGK